MINDGTKQGIDERERERERELMIKIKILNITRTLHDFIPRYNLRKSFLVFGLN